MRHDQPPLARDKLFKMWIAELEEEKEEATENQAPIIQLEEVEPQILKIAKKHNLEEEAKICLHLAWMTCARSIGALKGLGIKGIVKAGWRLVWLQHKTKKKTGIREVIIDRQWWTPFMKRYIPRAPTNVNMIFPEKTLKKVDSIISKVILRKLSIRRSSAQHMLDNGLPVEEIMKITLHKDSNTLSKYLRTRAQDLSRRN
eukprot:GILI01011885.1.p3 GENE.GILI01011885.1~~GILI01011885.1.p3  ORF type:complete len:201 (+),score=16.24 GILI01011885.1:369-971(+)